jgi:predicted enzyme related to lactoylglutathione lyase
MGKVVHFEVPFDDADRAVAFYRDVFGWQITSMPEMQYHLVTTGPAADDGSPTGPGYIGGGMLARQEPVRTPVITIAVDDIDAALLTVEANGGSTLEPKQAVGEMGFAAYFRDSEGNVLGLWQDAG